MKEFMEALEDFEKLKKGLPSEEALEILAKRIDKKRAYRWIYLRTKLVLKKEEVTEEEKQEWEYLTNLLLR